VQYAYTYAHTRACIYRLNIGALCIYIILNLIFLPRDRSGETGTRQMLSDSTRGSRGRFLACVQLNIIYIYIICSLAAELQGDKWPPPNAFCSCHPGANGFLLLCQTHTTRAYTYNTALQQHPECVCVWVCSGHIQLLFPAGKTRGDLADCAINRGRGKLK